MLKGGMAGFQQLRTLPTQPTAIVCSNDMTAIGVLRAVYNARLRVPQELSVIGLDDIAFAEFTLPPLTTIRLSRAELARAAFEALRLQAEDGTNRSYNANSWYQRAWWSAARQRGRELREQTAISALRIDR